MILFFILVFLFFSLITSNIKISLYNIHFNSKNHDKINEDYMIEIFLKIFFVIPIYKAKVNHKKIEKILEKQKTKFIENKKNIDLKILKEIKKLKVDLEEITVNVMIGTENAAFTSFIVAIISTILALFINMSIKTYNRKQKFKVMPVYINQNLIKIEFSGIFKIKMIHIINVVCNLIKRKGDKNERTSNRRSYEYRYE